MASTSSKKLRSSGTLLADEVERRFRNVDLEVAFLAYAVKKDPLAARYALPAWFSVSTLRKVCELARSLEAPASAAVFFQEAHRRKILGGTRDAVAKAYLEKILAVPVAQMTRPGARLIATQLADLHDSLRILKATKALTDSMKNGWDVSRAQALLKEAAKKSRVGGERTSGEWLEDYESRVEIVHERGNRETDSRVSAMVPTGIPHFDRWLGGGLLKDDGEFGTIIGRPGIGKTTTLVNIAAFAYAQGYNVAYGTGEMSTVAVQFRVDAYTSGISGAQFRSGELTDDDWARWRKTIEVLRSTRDNFLEVISFPRHFTIATLEERVADVEDKHGKTADLVLLDYINIVDPIVGLPGEWRAQREVIWDFKGFLKEHNGGTAGWTATQITDEGADSDVLQLKNVKYARAIAETSPIVVGLVQTDDDELEKQLQFQILKLRESSAANRVIYLHPDLDRMRLSAVLQPQSLQGGYTAVASLAEVKAKAKRAKGKHNE